MAQGKSKKLITKKARKGIKGYPVATVAFYGPTNVVATKLVCGIIKHEGAEAEPMKKWVSESDVRKSEKILSEVLVFIEENEAKSIGMVDVIIGCPHEEGIDYPEGESCEGVPEGAKAIIKSEYESIQYANTNSKSVLGSMNDLAFHYKHHIQSEGGVHSYAVPSIITKLNRMPMGALKYVFPVEALKAVYESLP